MHIHRIGPPLRRTLLAALTVALALSACGGSDDSDSAGDPQEVLATAKQHFDAAEAITFDLAASDKPATGDGVLAADGTMTHQPAFEGSVTVLFSGLSANVPVVSVDGTVHAKLPLTTGYQVIDPAEYGVPDPADFADPDTGLSNLLVQLDDVTQGEEVRSGDDVLTTYTGTIAGEKVKPIIPGASQSGTYDATVGINDSGDLATLSVTGEFFAQDQPVTYDVTFDYSDDPVTITEP